MTKLTSLTECTKLFKNTFKHIFQFIFASSLFLIVVFVLPLGILLFVPLKTCIFISAKLFRRDLLNFVSSPSSIFTIEDIATRPKNNLVLFFVADGHIEIDKFRDCVQHRIIQKLKPKSNCNASLLMYPELKQYWTTFLNYTFWKADENFELTNHVRLYDYGQGNGQGQGHGPGDDGDLTLPDVEDGLCIDESDLNRLIGPLLLKPWKKRQSPWEMLLIQNFKSNQSSINKKPSTVIVIRLHHALADGYSLLKLLVRDLMLNPSNARINFPRMQNMWKKIGFSLILPCKICWDIAGTFITTYVGTTRWHGAKKSLQLLTNMSKPIDMQIIKNIKNKYGVSYNAVLSSAVAASCRRLLENAGQIVPQDIACGTPIPLPRHPDGLVNHMSEIYKNINILSSLTGDAFKWPMTSSATTTREERLCQISKQMSKSKYYTTPLRISLMAKYANILPNSVLMFCRQFFKLSTAVISSLPGPERAFEFKGVGVNMVDFIYAFGPAGGQIGITVSMLSMNGKQRFTSVIDKSVFDCEKHFQNFDTYIEEELMALWEGEQDLKINCV